MIKPLSLISILTDQVELVRQRQIGIIIAGLGASYPLVFVVNAQRALAATMIRAVSKRFDLMHRICICFCLNACSFSNKKTTRNKVSKYYISSNRKPNAKLTLMQRYKVKNNADNVYILDATPPAFKCLRFPLWQMTDFKIYTEL